MDCRIKFGNKGFYISGSLSKWVRNFSKSYKTEQIYLVL